MIGAPKFFFADVGIVNVLAGRGALVAGIGALRQGLRELGLPRADRGDSHYRERYLDLSYWRLASGIEVDFVIGDLRCAVDASAAARSPRTT